MHLSKQKADWALHAFLVTLAGAVAVAGIGFAVTSDLSAPLWLGLSGVGAVVSGVAGWLVLKSSGRYSC